MSHPQAMALQLCPNCGVLHQGRLHRALTDTWLAGSSGANHLEHDMSRLGERIILGCSMAATLALIVAVLSGAALRKPQVFDEIQVHRIDVVEPDGTLRMVISNKAQLPGVIVKGKEQLPSDRPQAGMLFYNEDGSETGGLIFGGHRNADGRVENCCGSLSFDRYGANQIVQLAGVDDVTDQFTGVSVRDTRQRIWVGRKGDGAKVVQTLVPESK
jgi:hypothetical protein